MVNKTDTLIGYFWFDHDIDQQGQRVTYAEDSITLSKKRFYTRKYEYFQSDSMFLETFGAVPMLTGDVLIMIPRIINGKVQLFDFKCRGCTFSFIKSEHYFVKKDDHKLKVKKNKFKEQMKELIGDDSALMGKIDREELKYEDLEQIIFSYNHQIFVNNKQ